VVAISLGLAVLLSLVVFPSVGWMLAIQARVADPSQIIRILIERTLIGSHTVAILVFAITWFAAADGMLYGIVEGVVSLTDWSRRRAVTTVLLCSLLLGQLLLRINDRINLGIAVSCIFLPISSVIVALELGLFNRALLASAQNDGTMWTPVRLHWRPLIALTIGSTIGLSSFRLLPGPALLQVGLPPFYGWVAGALSYMLLRSL
jgi:hypothetical protein